MDEISIWKSNKNIRIMNDYYTTYSEIGKLLGSHYMEQDYSSITSYNIDKLVEEFMSISAVPGYEKLHLKLTSIWDNDIRPLLLESGLNFSFNSYNNTDDIYYIILIDLQGVQNILSIKDKGIDENLYYIEDNKYTKEELVNYILKWALSILD